MLQAPICRPCCLSALILHLKLQRKVTSAHSLRCAVLQPSRAVGLVAGISRVGLKSLVESVRLQTLSRAGLQQLQLDAHYLRPLLHR